MNIELPQIIHLNGSVHDYYNPYKMRLSLVKIQMM